MTCCSKNDRYEILVFLRLESSRDSSLFSCKDSPDNFIIKGWLQAIFLLVKKDLRKILVVPNILGK